MGRESFWGARILSVSGAEEIQAARAGVSEPLSRIFDLPGVPGTRLRLEARQVKINGKNICEVCAMTVEDAAKFFAGVQLSRRGSRDCGPASGGNPRAAAISQ